MTIKSDEFVEKGLELNKSIEYAKDSIVSKTIIEKKTGTVSLFAFDEGQNLSEHTAPFDALVFVVDGEKVKQSYPEAIKWYTLAAEQGHDLSQYSLGFLNYKGMGVTQDYPSAFNWFSLAAEQGHSLSQQFLGLMFKTGKGVKQSYKTAIKIAGRFG